MPFPVRSGAFAVLSLALLTPSLSLAQCQKSSQGSFQKTSFNPSGSKMMGGSSMLFNQSKINQLQGQQQLYYSQMQLLKQQQQQQINLYYAQLLQQQQQQQYYQQLTHLKQQQEQINLLLTYMAQQDYGTLQQALTNPNPYVRWAASLELAKRQ